MNNRSAAREIVILAIPQLPKDKSRLESMDFDQIMLALSRSLSDYAKKNISSVTSDLIKMENFLLNAEIEHPDNEKHISQIKSVLIPDTAVLRKQINALKASAQELFNAVELPELVVHTQQKQTIDYVREVLKQYVENKKQIDDIIEQAAQNRDKDKKWKLNRMVRLDRDILRMSATELLFLKDTPTEVICDEAVKIADKYGDVESKRFVNGVLRDVVELTRKNHKAAL
ncbi:MAG: transcription antitermination factor NusB [Candidatus Melainabacteria bacterium RIFCSPHIGHO2_02_FULL_34_12]|nr:MAG: transcription antitermination factor NusB [Candidatus Melainabacteria bacterium RIFCSPHIGHO2_02_FULL_34_12]